MVIVAVPAAGGPALLSTRLAHGADPHRLLWEHGYRAVRFLSASLVEGEVTLTVQVAPHHSNRTLRRPHRVRTMDPGLKISVEAEIVLRQRPAAYAMVLSDRGLLATEFSPKTAVPGMWGLPGGGIDDGENPAQTVIREVAEETSQRIDIDHLLDVQTDHWIGVSPSGTIEDFQAVRIIYAAHCVNPTDPSVIDVGGTTASARWIRLADWRHASWTTGFRSLLDRHLPTLTESFEQRFAG